MKTLFISAGHSTKDPGASGNGKNEADIVVEFRNIVGFYLGRMRAVFGMDGDGLQNMALADAAKRAKQYSIAVEFHCNAGPPTATGVETLSGPKDVAIGAKLCAAIAAELGIRNRGAKPEASGQHSRLAFVQAGGIIVELFFISNADDLARYEAKKWTLGRKVAETLVAHATI